ncbi:MAG: hypothetical protein LBL73_06350 [Synergistaceae bacterium]|nr:hypothetical protein [Synergistaceae bacterium]
MRCVHVFAWALFVSLALTACVPSQAAGAAAGLGLDELSFDFAPESVFKASYARLEGERYKPIGNPYLVWEPFGGKPGDPRLMIVCARVSERAGQGVLNALRDIQLLLVRDEGAKLELLQRVKLGNGTAPQVLQPGPDLRDILDGADFMVRVMRSGNNTEAYVYRFDEGALKLSETLRINRSFPEKFNVRVKGTLEQDGFVRITSTGPDRDERLNLSHAVEALTEDGIYQPNGRPIPSMRNLSCVRAGYEGEDLVTGRDGTEVHVGMSLLTPSRKQTADVTAILTKDGNGCWLVTDYRFEPFLPYRF